MARLPIHQMAVRHPGLTQATADANTEAASVCLNRHHVSPVDVDLDRDGATTVATVDWAAPDERTRRTWANETDTTEAGAYACALAAVELTDGLFAVGRAEILTGADYYIAPEGRGTDDLEECRRLRCPAPILTETGRFAKGSVRSWSKPSEVKAACQRRLASLASECAGFCWPIWNECTSAAYLERSNGLDRAPQTQRAMCVAG